MGAAYQTNLLGKIKMSLVVDQQDDTELVEVSQQVEETGLWNFQQICLGPPLEDHTPTLTQWVALHHRLFVQQASPYADFAVWLPYGEKILKEFKYQVWKQVGLGEYRKFERTGRTTSWRGRRRGRCSERR